MTDGDLRIHGGIVVDERQARHADLLVRGGQVAAIVPPESEAALHRTWTLRRDGLPARWPLGPFVEHQFRGAVGRTLVRGTLVYREGQIEAAPGHGRLLVPEAVTR